MRIEIGTGSAFHVYDVGVYLVFIDMFVRNNILSTIAFVILHLHISVIFLSRNIGKRRNENTWFLNKTYKLRMWGRKRKANMTMRKTHHICNCRCKQKNSWHPKGKGRSGYVCQSCSPLTFIKELNAMYKMK